MNYDTVSEGGGKRVGEKGLKGIPLENCREKNKRIKDKI